MENLDSKMPSFLIYYGCMKCQQSAVKAYFLVPTVFLVPLFKGTVAWDGLFSFYLFIYLFT